MNNKKNYLVVLAGSPRGGSKTWNSLIKNVISPLKADLAICTSEKFYQKSILTKEAKYEWIFKEPDNWFEYYEINFNNNWKNFFSLGLKTGLYNSGSIHFAIKDIVLRNYLKIIENYDYMIYSRFDQFYVGKQFEVKTNGKKIFIPAGEDYFGINDRHAIVETSIAKQFLDICTYIDDNVSTLNPPEYLNCETAYYRFLKEVDLLKHVHRYERSQFTTSQSIDKTNWRVAKYKLYLYKDLFIKYPDEFMDTMKNALQKYKHLTAFSELRLVINYMYLKLRRFYGSLRKKN